MCVCDSVLTLVVVFSDAIFVCNCIIKIIFTIASEVSELNHEATRLTEHLTALRRDSEQVVDLLTQLKAENQVKREEEERRRKEGLKVVNKKTVQVQQELEVTTRDRHYCGLCLPLFRKGSE